MTQAGRRFYRQSYTRYIIHVPTYLTRHSSGARFSEDHYDITGEQLGMDVKLNARGSEQEQLSQLERAYVAWLASGAAAAIIVPPSDNGSDVEMHIDPARRPTFDIQHAHVRDGTLTADTLLDRVVFGARSWPRTCGNCVTCTRCPGAGVASAVWT